METLPAFKAYDVRGRIPDQLNEDMARDIGRAYAWLLRPKTLAVGHDVRLTSVALSDALVDGLRDGGVDVVHIGLCGTEEIYFATSHLGLDGGIMVTASHNPMDYNGMKLVSRGSRPIGRGTGLMAIEAVVRQGEVPANGPRGGLQQVSVREDYLQHMLSYISVAKLSPMTVVSNPGNGCAGPVVEALAEHLPITLVPLHHEPDGRFPNGIPNPLLPRNRPPTSEKVRQVGADLGLAWDGDFDRCFFFDESGRFIEGYYIVGLLAQQLLSREPGGRIIYDPRLTWNTEEMVRRAGGVPIQSRSGHAFIKDRMRSEDALYGGEMSAHHYFRDFFYCDSGMIPWLLVLELLSDTGLPLSALVSDRIAAFPASGEINRHIPDADAALHLLHQRYSPEALKVETVDGLSVAFEDWRFNVRKSNTEPLLRLNVESRADAGLLSDKTNELLSVLNKLGATAP